jgi:hypothetical protein
MISFDFIDVVNILNTLLTSFGFYSTKSLMNFGGVCQFVLILKSKM